MGRIHRQGQGRVSRYERTNAAGERVLNSGRTGKSLRNGLRLTDGRDHPVTVRHVDL